MIFLDNVSLEFPPLHKANADGLLAIGGDLSADRLKIAYQQGIFPWFNELDPILWWSPDPRFVLYPCDLKLSKSMKKVLRDQTFQITYNQCFKEVITHCQSVGRKSQTETWISQSMIDAYLDLHEQGWAKSVEVWHDNLLVGGLYGVDLGTVFCGESMFSHMSNASKAGFIWLVESFKTQYKLIDCQVYTDHLKSLGATYIPRTLFVDHLQNRS